MREPGLVLGDYGTAILADLFLCHRNGHLSEPGLCLQTRQGNVPVVITWAARSPTSYREARRPRPRTALRDGGYNSIGVVSRARAYVLPVACGVWLAQTERWRVV
jgi:hypothetical protein